jgi:hypothetical protein
MQSAWKIMMTKTKVANAFEQSQKKEAQSVMTGL